MLTKYWQSPIGNFKISIICPLAKERAAHRKTELCDKVLSQSDSLESFDLGSLVLILDPWFLLRKEVIQPQVPLRLPCYDFIPITTHTFGTCPSCELARRLRVQTAFMM